MRCNICQQTLQTEDPVENMPHWETCSAGERQKIRVLIEHDSESKLLNTFKNAKAEVELRFKRLGFRGADLLAPTERFLRMWRANELLGRNDYLDQLQDLPYYNVNDEDPESIVDVIKGALKRHGDVLQTVLAVEDTLYDSLGKTPSPHLFTVFDDNTAPKSNLHLYPREHGALHIKFGAWPLEEIAREFYLACTLTYDTPARHPLALSRAMLILQTDGASSKYAAKVGGSREFTAFQDTILLKMLGKGLPMVEVARRLNGEIATLTKSVPARTQYEVQRRVDQLLQRVM